MNFLKLEKWVKSIVANHRYSMEMPLFLVASEDVNADFYKNAIGFFIASDCANAIFLLTTLKIAIEKLDFFGADGLFFIQSNTTDFTFSFISPKISTNSHFNQNITLNKQFLPFGKIESY